MSPHLIAATGGATDVAALSVPTLLLPTLTEQASPQLSCAVYIHGLASSSSLLSPCYPSGVVMDPLQFLLPPSQYHRPGLLRPLHHIPTIQIQAPQQHHHRHGNSCSLGLLGLYHQHITTGTTPVPPSSLSGR